MGGDLRHAPKNKLPSFLVAALDRLRSKAFQYQNAQRGEDDHPGTGLYFTHLVYSEILITSDSTDYSRFNDGR